MPYVPRNGLLVLVLLDLTLQRPYGGLIRLPYICNQIDWHGPLEAVGDRRTTIKYVFEYFRLNLLLIRAYIQEQLRRVILSRYSQNCW